VRRRYLLWWAVTIGGLAIGALAAIGILVALRASFGEPVSGTGEERLMTVTAYAVWAGVALGASYAGWRRWIRRP
jgi:hypothetical protein